MESASDPSVINLQGGPAAPERAIVSDHSILTATAADRTLPTGPITRRSRAVLVVAAMAVIAVMIGAGPVAAHGGPGVIEVGDPEATDDLTIEFPVRITYENDGHAAEEVEGLTVRGKGPNGAELAPIDAFVAGDAPGVFRATVTLPVEGQWDLIIEVVEPPATATISAEISGAVTETTSSGDAGSLDTAPDGPDGAPDDGAPDNGAIATPGAAPTNEGDEGEGGGADDLDTPATGEAADDAAAGETGDDDGGFPWVAAIIAVALAGAAAVVGFRLATRRNAAGVS